MSIHNRIKIDIPLAWAIAVVVILLIVLLVGYLKYAENQTFVNVAGGIIGGLIVYLISIVEKYTAFTKLHKFKKMKVRAVLRNRHDQDYYRSIVGRARSRVYVTGASCSRFIADFLEIESDDNVLVNQLQANPNLVVKILVPDDDHMGDVVSKKFNLQKGTLEALAKRFGSRVQIRRFSQHARISAVIVDDELLTGPIFTDSVSRRAPGIHIDCSTDYAQKHIDYIEQLWKQATDFS